VSSSTSNARKCLSLIRGEESEDEFILAENDALMILSEKEAHAVRL
jgi:hypothetical protein